MDNFNDFYNRFVVSTYGTNVLNYLFFLAVFFTLILFGVCVILLRFGPRDNVNRMNYQLPQPQQQQKSTTEPVIVAQNRRD